MDGEAVRGYVGRAEGVFDQSPQMDEANTKAAVLRHFLELLDWTIPTNAQLEYPVEAFGKTYKVDYALVLDETPVAFLEAKGVDTTLTSEHEDKLSSYLKNEDVTYGILTNGERYQFFQRRLDDGTVSVRLIADVELSALPDRKGLLEAYTKGAIESGESGKILGRINELREARETLESNKDALASELTTVMTDTVSEAIASLAEPQAKEMIDRVIEDIDAEIDANGEQQQTEPPSPTTEPPGSTGHSDVTGDYGIEIRNGGRSLAAFADDNQSDVMADSVEHLISEHGLLDELGSLPYVPGEKRALLNHEPVHPDGRGQMRTYREVAGDYYLYTTYNKRDKKRYVSLLAEKCGLDIVTFGDW